jgi:hypothetical protein
MVFYTAETHRWPMAIDIAWAFLDIFPNIDILRVGWPYTPWQWAWPGRSGEFWEIAVGNDLSNSSDEEKVHKFEEYIREEIADGMSLPSQFQLLQERHGQCVETHFTEAVRNVQRTVSASADDDSASQDAPTEKKKKNDVIDPKQPAQPSMRYALRSRKDHNT